MTPEEKPKTVRVRIPISVSKEGRWQAHGFSADYFDSDLKKFDIVHWIEADVPLPVAETIEGKVV